MDQKLLDTLKRYEGGCRVGLLKVDHVKKASEKEVSTPIAPWILQLRKYVKKRFPDCKIYCSDHGASFNEVTVQTDYQDHIFIWRTAYADFIRAVKASEMEKIIAGRAEAKAKQLNKKKEDIGEIALNVSTLETKDTVLKSVRSAALKGFADACAEKSDNIPTTAGLLLAEISKQRECCKNTAACIGGAT